MYRNFFLQGTFGTNPRVSETFFCSDRGKETTSIQWLQLLAREGDTVTILGLGILAEAEAEGGGRDGRHMGEKHMARRRVGRKLPD